MSGGARTVALRCANCNAQLQVPPGIDVLACGYCGAEQTVERGGGIVALKPVVEVLQRVEAGTGRVVAELALQRLRCEAADAESAYFAARQAAEHSIVKAREEYGTSRSLAKIVCAVIGIALACVVGLAFQSGGAAVVSVAISMMGYWIWVVLLQGARNTRIATAGAAEQAAARILAAERGRITYDTAKQRASVGI
jgi:hypothetical protein